MLAQEASESVQGGPLTTQQRATSPFRARLAGGLLMAAALCAAAPASPAPLPQTPPAPAPPSGLTVADVPNDAGTSLTLAWRLSPDDGPGRGVVAGYQLERAVSPSGPWSVVDSLAPGTSERVDGGVHRNTPYFYRVAAFGPGGLTLALANAGP